MNPFTSLYETLSTHLFFWHWRDGIEIIFFSCLFYSLSVWLKKDQRKNLLPYFYGYCVITFSAYLLKLSTVSAFLLLFWPAAVMLFMFMHQQTLQRNIVALKNITATKQPTSDWLDTVLRISLLAMNNNKDLYCVIEHTDSITEFIDAPLPITADLDKGLLELLLESQSYDAQKMIWVNTQGQLRGINVTWPHQDDTDEFNSTEWEHETLLYTAKTDTIAFHCNATTRTFTLIIGEKILPNVSTDHAQQLIKKHVSISTHKTTQSVMKKGACYETKNQKPTAE